MWIFEPDLSVNQVIGSCREAQRNTHVYVWMCTDAVLCCAWCAGPIGKAVSSLLVIQSVRPDRLMAMARILVEKGLGTGFTHAGDKELNLADIVEKEVILLVSCLCVFWK